MSQEEKTGRRDAHYSVWHRANSTRRYVGLEDAQLLGMVDIDVTLYTEFPTGEKVALAFVETARDTGQEFKSATVLRDVAKRSNLPAYIALYSVGTTPNPADPRVEDIVQFRVRQIWPEPATRWHTMTPQQWAEALLRIRRRASRQRDIEDGIVVAQAPAANSA